MTNGFGQSGEGDGKDLLEIEVDCYAGYRGEETPRSLRIGSGEIRVEEVLDRWLAPDHRYFKLRGEDGTVYIVRHDEGTGTWQLTLMDAGAS